jgi:hypothetical protein
MLFFPMDKSDNLTNCDTSAGITESLLSSKFNFNNLTNLPKEFGNFSSSLFLKSRISRFCNAPKLSGKDLILFPTALNSTRDNA